MKGKAKGKERGEAFKVSENGVTPFCPVLCPILYHTKWNKVAKKAIAWPLVTLTRQQKWIFWKVNEI